MVNTGKPSTGCGRCRARRIKCDEGKPECTRCVKYKRPCPGYRESTDNKLRYKPRKPRTLARDVGVPSLLASTQSQIFLASSLCSAAASSQEGSTAVVRSPTPENRRTVPRPWADEINVQAECYFVCNFVEIPEAGPSKGYLGFIIPLLRSQSSSKCLPLAFSAVAFAALASYQKSAVSIPKAQMTYLEALKEIKVALRDPQQSLDDSVIASVLLLAKFEQISPSEMTLGGWRSHIAGANSLLKARGKRRCETPFGRELVIAVREQVIPLSIALGSELDPEFDWAEADEDETAKAFTRLQVEMVQLQADNKNTTALAERSPENTRRVVSLLRRSEALEQKYADWLRTLPATWDVTSADWSTFEAADLASSLVYPGRLDSFRELWMAIKCNIARSCRVLIWSTILRCVAWLNGPDIYKTTTEYAAASRDCRQLIKDIIASVPYYFGWTPTTHYSTINTCSHKASILATLKGRSGNFLLWPLYVSSCSDFCLHSERLYLRGKLRFIAENLGVNQAAVALKDKILYPSNFIEREGMTFTKQSTDLRVNCEQSWATCSPEMNILALRG
ncbi:hypothetical protein PZA11_001388 [Diplocarpon coronariae]